MTRGITTGLRAALVGSLIVTAVTGPAFSRGALGADDDSASVLGQGGGALVLVLDGSGSMAEPSGLGGTRMEAAQDGLRGVIDDLPDDAEAGLRVYGSTIEDGAGSCEDSELLTPVGPVDRAALRAGVDELRPLGNTPIAYSLEQAYADLPEEGPRSIVLVSDGEENCGGDPCEVAADLQRKGAEFYVDVVGLQVDAASRSQLTCIASAGGGTYYDVQDLQELRETLSRTAVRAARGYEPAGLPVEGGESAADAVELRDGQWLDTLGDSGQEHYALTAPGEGGTVHVSASTLPYQDTLTDAFVLQVDLLDAAGEVCVDGDRTIAQGASNGGAPVTATATTVLGPDADCGEGPVVARVDSPDVEDVQSLEVLVRTEPAVEDPASLPAPPQQSGFSDSTTGGEPSTPPEPVIGGPNFSSAPPVEPGTYEDTVLVNETLFYRVPDVAWGQTAVCDVRLGGTDQARDAIGIRSGIRATTRLYGALKTPVVDSAATDDEALYGGDDLALHAAGPPVTYRSRETSSSSALLPTQLAGDQWCAVTVIRLVGPPAEEIGEIPLTLTTSVVGEESGVPAYVEEPAEDANDAAGEDEAGTSWWPILLGAAAVAALAAGFVVVVRRRAGAGEDDAAGDAS